MKLLIEMTLQSDAVFGNGLSIPQHRWMMQGFRI